MAMQATMPPEGGDAGAELSAPPAGTEGTQATVPMDMLPGCKAGDMYKVTSVEGGNVMLEHQPGAGGEEGAGWGEGLTKAAPRGDEGAM